MVLLKDLAEVVESDELGEENDFDSFNLFVLICSVGYPFEWLPFIGFCSSTLSAVNSSFCSTPDAVNFATQISVFTITLNLLAIFS